VVDDGGLPGRDRPVGLVEKNVEVSAADQLLQALILTRNERVPDVGPE